MHRTISMFEDIFQKKYIFFGINIFKCFFIAVFFDFFLKTENMDFIANKWQIASCSAVVKERKRSINIILLRLMALKKSDMWRSVCFFANLKWKMMRKKCFFLFLKCVFKLWSWNHKNRIMNSSLENPSKHLRFFWYNSTQRKEDLFHSAGK